MNFNNKTITLTFGDRAENHVGMQIIGELATTGFTLDHLLSAKQYFENKNYVCHLINLNKYCIETTKEQAYILVTKNGVKCLLQDKTRDDLFNEHNILDVDKKAFMYGRVVNKKARHNLCFGKVSQEPNYSEGLGKVIAFNRVELTNIIRHKIPEFIGDIGNNLQCEANYYYDIKICGIGWHGDSERKKVIGVRLGETLPLCFVWYHKGAVCSDILKINVEHGDIYIMSELTTGNNWKKKNEHTLRHAAGCYKYITIPNVNIQDIL